MRIGLQLSSLKAYLQTEQDVETTFRIISDMGWTDVQLQWIGENVPNTAIAEQMKKNGLLCWGTQDYYDVVTARIPYEMESARLYNAKYICVSGIPERYCSENGVKEMAGELNSLCAQLKDSGLQLTFHPRAQEYRQYGSMKEANAVEFLMNAVPDMQLTADCYHTEKSGVDTCALLRKYAGRTDIVHFKNWKRGENGESSVLCPLGEGMIDYEKIMRCCAETGVKVVLAEQESWQKDAFECMRDSLDYLNRTAKRTGVQRE